MSELNLLSQKNLQCFFLQLLQLKTNANFTSEATFWCAKQPHVDGNCKKLPQPFYFHVQKMQIPLPPLKKVQSAARELNSISCISKGIFMT